MPTTTTKRAAAVLAALATLVPLSACGSTGNGGNMGRGTIVYLPQYFSNQDMINDFVKDAQNDFTVETERGDVVPKYLYYSMSFVTRKGDKFTLGGADCMTGNVTTVHTSYEGDSPNNPSAQGRLSFRVDPDGKNTVKTADISIQDPMLTFTSTSLDDTDFPELGPLSEQQRVLDIIRNSVTNPGNPLQDSTTLNLPISVREILTDRCGVPLPDPS